MPSFEVLLDIYFLIMNKMLVMEASHHNLLKKLSVKYLHLV